MEALPSGEPTIAPAVRQLLDQIHRRFYAGAGGRDFHRDRRRLVYALGWPATWLEHRGLTCSSARYCALVADRLGDIAAHGDPGRYGAYFPAYLLKCLQDWFQHHGDELYEELKHIRNALDRVLASTQLATRVQRDGQQVTLLASAHRLIRAERQKRLVADGHQLSLF